MRSIDITLRLAGATTLALTALAGCLAGAGDDGSRPLGEATLAWEDQGSEGAGGAAEESCDDTAEESCDDTAQGSCADAAQGSSAAAGGECAECNECEDDCCVCNCNCVPPPPPLTLPPTSTVPPPAPPPPPTQPGAPPIIGGPGAVPGGIGGLPIGAPFGGVPIGGCGVGCVPTCANLCCPLNFCGLPNGFHYATFPLTGGVIGFPGFFRRGPCCL